jgi:hypothetical protein
MLACAERGVGGAFNVVGRPRHTTMGGLLRDAVEVTGADAELVWVSPEIIQEAGISPWIELPMWLPQSREAGGGMLDGDVSAAFADGLTCRPSHQTVADTWAWLRAEGDPLPRSDRPRHGLDPAKEQRVLDRIG